MNLNAEGIIAITSAEGWRLTLERGHAWLTVEGYSQDKYLSPGERFTVPSGGAIVVQGDRASRVRIEPPAKDGTSIAARAALALRQMVHTLASTTVESPERLNRTVR